VIHSFITIKTQTVLLGNLSLLRIIALKFIAISLYFTLLKLVTHRKLKLPTNFFLDFQIVIHLFCIFIL